MRLRYSFLRIALNYFCLFFLCFLLSSLLLSFFHSSRRRCVRPTRHRADSPPARIYVCTSASAAAVVMLICERKAKVVQLRDAAVLHTRRPLFFSVFADLVILVRRLRNFLRPVTTLTGPLTARATTTVVVIVVDNFCIRLHNVALQCYAPVG